VVGVSNDPGPQGPPQYYRPGPSSGTYPQYPQNPYPQGWTPGAQPAPYPQQVPDRPGDQGGPGPAPQWNTTAGWGPPPAGTVPSGDRGPSRPRQVVTGLVLLLASTVPFLVMGITTMFVTVDDALLAESGVPRDQLDQAMGQTGITMDQLTQLFRVMGGIFLVLALVYAALAVVAFLGRSGARLTVAILTAVYGLPLLLIMAASLPLFAVLVVAVASAGVVMLYSRPANEWYASRRVGAAQRPA
jgi:hypothetical protein